MPYHMAKFWGKTGKKNERRQMWYHYHQGRMILVCENNRRESLDNVLLYVVFLTNTAIYFGTTYVEDVAWR